jgi:DNA-binding transcriptional regulator GbsR (MarR family)
LAQLSPAVEKFVLHWGEMGTRWGVNRTVAQIHALLIVTDGALTAEDISTTLAVARSTVSTSLKELQNWQLIRPVHVLGDRRDHFESVGDAWDMAMIVADGRKRREVDPTIEILRACVDDTTDADEYARACLADLLEFAEGANSFYDQFRRLPRSAARQLFMRGSSLAGLLGRGQGTPDSPRKAAP